MLIDWMVVPRSRSLSYFIALRQDTNKNCTAHCLLAYRRRHVGRVVGNILSSDISEYYCWFLLLLVCLCCAVCLLELF